MGLFDRFTKNNSQNPSGVGNLQQPSPQPIGAQQGGTPIPNQGSIPPMIQNQQFGGIPPMQQQPVQPVSGGYQQNTPPPQLQQTQPSGGALDANFFTPMTPAVQPASNTQTVSTPTFSEPVSTDDSGAKLNMLHSYNPPSRPGEITSFDEPIMGTVVDAQSDQSSSEPEMTQSSTSNISTSNTNLNTTAQSNIPTGPSFSLPKFDPSSITIPSINTQPVQSTAAPIQRDSVSTQFSVNDIQANDEGEVTPQNNVTISKPEDNIDTDDTDQSQSSTNTETFSKEWYKQDTPSASVINEEEPTALVDQEESESDVPVLPVETKPVQSKAGEERFKILKKIGISGLHSDEPLNVQLVHDFIAVCEKNRIKIIFDADTQAGKQIMEDIKRTGLKATGILYKPFEAEYVVEENGTNDVTSNITTIYYSNILEQIQSFIKESRAFVLIHDNTFTTYQLLVNLLYLTDLYRETAKPVVLIGKGWKGKVSSIITELQIDPKVKEFITILDNAGDLEGILASKDAFLVENARSQAKVVDKRLQGDERDLHIAP